MSLAHKDFSPPPTLAFETASVHDEAACLAACERLARLPPGTWLALPVCGGTAGQDFAAVLKAALGGADAHFPYAAIAAEAERPFAHGIRGATPQALLLLAALALAPCPGSGADASAALTLADTALAIAARLGLRSLHDTRALYAALVAPYADGFGPASADLAALCEGELLLACTQPYLASNGFMAGLPLPELARQAARASVLPAADAHAGAVASELAVRTRLLEGLMERRETPVLVGASMPQDRRFGFWFTRLQAAIYDGDGAAARHAAAQAEPLTSPLMPVGDRMSYHLFAALAWSDAGESAAAALELHCVALRRLAHVLPACDLVQCAEAARASHAGDRLGALRGFDGAGVEAMRQGRQAVAALAWERAAGQAQANGLGAAVQHYRREALRCWEQWGASGRAAMLRQAWGCNADEHGQAEHERIERAGRIGELGLSIAHEVNQPLAAISLHAAAARKWLRRQEPDIERALSSLSLISAAGQHAGDIVRSVQRLAAHRELEMGSVAIDETISDTLRLLHRPLRKHGIEVELALGLGGCVIHASRVQLQQVLTNLVVNATEALAGAALDTARRIRIASRRLNVHEIEIAVADNGPGIAPRHADRVFGSLFSTKPNSTGMGLSISLAIVRAHGGHIEYEPCRPHGACFRFRLPVDSHHP